jgi:hypothetical protein
VNIHKARTTTWPASSDEDESDEDCGDRPLKAPRGKTRAHTSPVRTEEEGEVGNALSVTGKRRVRFQQEMFPPKRESSMEIVDGGDGEDSGDSPGAIAAPNWSDAVTKMEGRQRSGVKTKMKQWASKGVAAVNHQPSTPEP